MKKLVAVTILFSLSLAANAYVQNCYYGRTFVEGELVNTCKKCECKKGAKKAVAKKHKQNKLSASELATLKAQREAEAAAKAAAIAAKKEQQKKDAAALAAVGKVKTTEDEIAVVLHNDILFQTGKTDLSANSKQTLNTAVTILNRIPNRSLVIEGHTDSTGPEEFNMQLSEQRAKVVYDYMIEQGLKTKNVTYKGYGETKPVEDNDTAEGRRANRRVEFKIK